jgi:hypothetical protein
MNAAAAFLACRAAPRAAWPSRFNPEYLAMGDEYWKPDIMATTWNQADSGRIPVSGAGYRGRYPRPGFDSIWTDMSEIVRPTRDGIHGREYISTSVDIGQQAHALDLHPGRQVGGRDQRADRFAHSADLGRSRLGPDGGQAPDQGALGRAPRRSRPWRWPQPPRWRACPPINFVTCAAGGARGSVARLSRSCARCAWPSSSTARRRWPWPQGQGGESRLICALRLPMQGIAADRAYPGGEQVWREGVPPVSRSARPRGWRREASPHQGCLARDPRPPGQGRHARRGHADRVGRHRPGRAHGQGHHLRRRSGGRGHGAAGGAGLPRVSRGHGQDHKTLRGRGWRRTDPAPPSAWSI